MSAHDPTQEQDEHSGPSPYLAVIAVALVIGVGIAVYVFGYRDEILSILTQLPT
ncbi:MAG TPA: hypothetical protein VFH48_05630 [Chloroflexota bacterium]|nr:hypothetical protein [Chloroflexota bacterium]